MNRVIQFGAIRRFLCYVVGVLFLTLQPVDARTIKIATIDYEPFSSPRMREGGFQTALVRAAFAAVGHQAEFVFFPWKRALRTVIRGKVDFVTSIYYTPERNKDLHFTKPLHNTASALIGLKRLGVHTYENLADLSKYEIGVLAGAVFDDEFDHADYLNKTQVHSDELNMSKLYHNRLDLVATTPISFQYRVAQSIKYDPADLVVLQPLLSVRPTFIAASRNIPDHEALVADFNKGLAIIIDNGMFNQIVESFGITFLRK